MSTKYFMLSKSTEKSVNDKTSDQIIFPNTNTYILPHVNMNYYISHGLFESELIEWSKQFCSINKNVLDIGSHTGTYAISLASISKHVYCFEPQRLTYYSLCGGVALSNLKNVMCYNFGLGSKEQIGDQILNIVSNDGGGSTMTKFENVLESEKITICTMDSLNLNDIGFIKMDVEGNEFDVLLGAIETLKRNSYPTILFESNDVGKDINVFELLKTLNYNIHNINNFPNMFLACK